MLIQSLTNNKVKQWTSLHLAKQRKATGLFLVEGEHLVLEAHMANAIENIIVLDGFSNPYPGYETYEVTDAIMKKLSLTDSSSNIIALCHKPSIINKDHSRVLVCDRIQDPGNLGTLIRTAYAFGFDQILCSNDTVDYTNEKVIRSSQGAIFHIEIQYSDLKETLVQLKKQGFMIYGTDVHQATDLNDIQSSAKVAVILGNEGDGLDKTLVPLCDDLINIEMAQFESLNVAIAGGILCYHFRKV